MDADEARIVEGLRGSDDMFQQVRPLSVWGGREEGGGCVGRWGGGRRL